MAVVHTMKNIIFNNRCYAIYLDLLTKDAKSMTKHAIIGWLNFEQAMPIDCLIEA